MNVAIFYDGNEVQSVFATAVLKMKYRSDTVTIVDLQGLNEGQMTTAIDTITDATQDRVFCTCITTASYSAAGHPSIDVNIADMEDKIAVTAVSPWNAAISLGNASGTKNPCLLAWENAYTGIAVPPVIHYLGGSAQGFPLDSGTATSVQNDGITHTGHFTLNQHAGRYVYVTSSTLGAGQIRYIVSNTTAKLTVSPNWDLNPTGTVVYGVVQYKDEALRLQYLNYSLKALLWNISDNAIMRLWYKLLDMGAYDSSYNSISSGSLVGPTVDSGFLESLILLGKAIYQNAVFPCYGEATIPEIK